MSSIVKRASLVAALALAGMTVAEAAPVPAGAARTVGVGNGDSAASVQAVAYRRYYGGRYYGGRYYGRRYYNPAGAAVAGAALGLMGAGIAAATAPSWGYGYGYPAYGYYPSYGYPAYGYGSGYYGW